MIKQQLCIKSEPLLSRGCPCYRCSPVRPCACRVVRWSAVPVARTSEHVKVDCRQRWISYRTT